MSSYDEMLTTVSDEVREAIELVCDRAGTFDADWCVLKAAGEIIANSAKLPRVSAEGLLEGKWYIVRDYEGSDLEYLRADVSPYSGKFEFHVAAEAGRPTDFLQAADMFGIWGPVEFELEEDNPNHQ